GDLQADGQQGAVGRGQRHHRATGADGDRIPLRDQVGAHQLLDQLGDGGLGEPGALGQAGAGGRRGRGGGGRERGEDGGEVVLTQVCGLHLGLLAMVPGGAASVRHARDLWRQLGPPTRVPVPDQPRRALAYGRGSTKETLLMTAPTPTRDDRFSFGLWTTGWQAQDQFGSATRPALEMSAHIRRLAELGAW